MPRSILVLFLAVACASAQPAPTAPAPSNQPPPILDRELFFGDPEITAAQLSPDGRYTAFIKPYNGVRNVWVKETGKPFASAHPVTNDPKRPIPSFFFTRDSKWILFVQDQGGDENFNVFAVNPAAELSPARDLTQLKKVRAQIYDLPKVDPDVLYVGFNDRDPAWHDLYKVKISTGAKELLRKNTDRVTGWVFDNAGKLRLATRSAPNGDTEVLRVDPAGFEKIYTCSVLESCDAVRFDKQNQRVYFETNKGEQDLVALTLLDPATGKTEVVETDPEGRADFGQAVFRDDTDELVATVYSDEKPKFYFRDPAMKADYELLQQKFTGKDVSPGSTTFDEQLWLVNVQSPTEPGERWLFDRKTKALTFEYRLREQLPREALSPMEYIHYPSSDGLSIPAYLTVPKGFARKGLPLIVLPHGGPWSRTSSGYHGLSQFLANRGYAVLEPNFRASTGYGKKFLNAGNKQWGDKMQDDLTWGVKHLVDSGVADGKRAGIMGGSYGGYATLAGVTFTPDLYAAAVAIVAPSNLISLLETIPPYWEAGRKVFAERMGDASTAEGRAQLERQSPLTHVAKIRTPLMVVQGANDPRVNKREADQIVVALRDRGFPVAYILAPDEGHGFQRPINNLATFAAAEQFLAKYLGGRAQADLKPEIAQRLAELTVDPKTVVVAKKAEAAAEAPKPELDLAPHTSKYHTTIALGPQTMQMDVTHTVREVNGAWEITDVAKSPMGEAQERTVLAKKTLAPVHREVAQGPVKIVLDFAGGHAKGTAAMGGEPKPFDVDLGGATYGDGNAESDSLAHLPLTEGATTSYRQLDMRRQKPVVKQVKVGASEKVKVPAGTFDAVKLLVTGDGGEVTMWVDRKTREVVKQSGVLAEMNGAQLTTELVK